MRDLRDFLDEVPELDATEPPKAGADIPIARPLVDFADTPPDPARTLLGDRFLCKQGGGLFIGQSGIGKSVASVQQDLLWSIGRPAFGIKPTRPLRILTIQAEDDDGDLSEMVSGITKGIGLTDDEKALSRENCRYVTHKSCTGPEFLTKVVRPLLNRDKFDLLRINPLQAYLGGDIKDPAVTGAFLRNGLNPLLEEFHCGNLTVHHTPKVTFRETKEWKASDWMYAGAGAADITNWARAILVIEATDDPYIFKFIAAKRGSRIGWIDGDTGEKEFIRYFAHEKGGIFWRDADPREIAQAAAEVKRTAKDLYELVPFHGSIAKDLLFAKASGIKIGRVKAKNFLAELTDRKELFEWEIKRKGTNAEKHIARYEQPPA
jgi:AAA domain-containing protein